MREAEIETDDRLLVTAAEAARLLSLSPARVYELAAAGVLERRFIGSRNFRITVESLRTYVAQMPDEPTDGELRWIGK